MGLAERDYSQEGRSGRRFLGSLPPVTKWILIANVLIFLLDVFSSGGLTALGAYSIPTSVYQGKIWQFVTFQFLHGHVAHLLMNSIGLYAFAPLTERWWGSRKFAVFYLLSGIGGVAFFTLLTAIGVFPNGISAQFVGASAGLYGILAAVAVRAPDLPIRLLFPPVEMKMRTLALILLGVAVGAILLRIESAGSGEAGHLGGAMAGFLMIRFPHLLAWAEARDPDSRVIRPKAFSRRRKAEAKLRPRVRVDLRGSTEVDLILDKISREGMQSLTDEDRAVLARASKSKQPKR